MKRRKKQNPDLPPTESELIDDYIKELEQKDKAHKTVKYKPRYKRRRRFLLPFLISLGAVALIAAVIGLFHFNIIKLSDFIGTETSSATSSNPSQPQNFESVKPEAVAPDRPMNIYGATVIPNKDFELDNILSFEELAKEASGNGLTTLFVDFSGGVGLITDTDEGKQNVTNILQKAKEYDLSIFALVDISKLTYGDFTTSEATVYASQKMQELCALKDLGGIMLSGLELSGDKVTYTEYLKTGTLNGYSNFCKEKLNGLVKNLNIAVKKAKPTMLFGLVCDSIYATDKDTQGGMSVTSDEDMLNDQNADVLFWMQENYFDMTFITVTTTTVSSSIPFDTVINWWNDNTPVGHDLGFMLSSERASKATGNWTNPDQLCRQLMAIKDIDRYVFCFDSYSALKNDTSGFANLIYKYLKAGLSENYVLRDLTFTSPKETEITTYENTVSIIGASDPNFELTLNGEAVERTELGFFSLDLKLKVGANEFTFEHKGKTVTYTVYYRYVVIKDYSPAEKVTLDGGSSIMVKVTARNGSTVKATLKDTTVTLTKAEGEDDSDFSTYIGILDLPDGFKEDTELGKIVFTGTHSGITETFKGGSVTVRKTAIPETPSLPSAPSGGNDDYIGVGNTLIAQVTKYQVETFDGNTVDDFSQPYNNYLPAGTVDYCEEKTTYDPASGNTYRLLRYGKRVYSSGNGTANIKTFRGSLPETNQLSVENITTAGSHTVLTLNTAWKAPFKLELAPQKYNSSSTDQRGAITSVTFSYVDITFCYASQLSGDFAALNNSPIFSKVEVIKNTADYTLRLHLKKVGAFYGWTAEYNSNGDLVFRFLNPAKATVSNNKYGGRLDGITIVVDAGHGGSDGGAVGSNPTYDEANRNLALAEMIRKKLESLGAKVIMTRTTDVSLSSDERILLVKNAKPDLAISVHRDSSTKASANGFGAYHFNAYTKAVAEKIKKRMDSANTYSKTNVKWHYFYLSRISDCPVVLTENGFMSNSTDYNNMLSDSWNDKCADAIVHGVVDYFLSIG